MPFSKIIDQIDGQIDDRIFLKGIKGSEQPKLNQSQRGQSLIRWTLQAGTGDGEHLINLPEAVSSYRESEKTHSLRHLKALKTLPKLNFNIRVSITLFQWISLLVSKMIQIRLCLAIQREPK